MPFHVDFFLERINIILTMKMGKNKLWNVPNIWNAIPMILKIMYMCSFCIFSPSCDDFIRHHPMVIYFVVYANTFCVECMLDIRFLKKFYFAF